MSLVELVRLDGESGRRHRACRSTGAPAAGSCCRWCTSTRCSAPRPHQPTTVNIVVVQSDDTQFGLVDEISDTAEIVK
ncbi:MAG: hypothetical protein R2713_10285 [Ilumatobacteraceae bacterium]